MTWIKKNVVNTPATHAIVIGVGNYQYCEPGFQLTSPPHSAIAFAKWLVNDFTNVNKPLESLALFVSDHKNRMFTLPSGGRKRISKANKVNVTNAMYEWKELCDLNKDNLTIFFFCGHGIAKHPFTVLLLDDYRQNPANPFANTIDFFRCHIGLDKCEALHQCYFIDACRVTDPEILRTSGPIGDPVFHPDLLLGEREAPIFYSTIPGAEAYGRENNTSLFTAALLKVLKGAASDNPDDVWWIYSNRILESLNFYLKNLGDDTKQRATGDGIADPFKIHQIAGKPIVPVTIECNPNDANPQAILSYTDIQNGKRSQRPDQAPNHWFVTLEEGDYAFDAQFNPPHPEYQNGQETRTVRPPKREVSIDV